MNSVVDRKVFVHFLPQKALQNYAITKMPSQLGRHHLGYGISLLRTLRSIPDGQFLDVFFGEYGIEDIDYPADKPCAANNPPNEGQASQQPVDEVKCQAECDDGDAFF